MAILPIPVSQQNVCVADQYDPRPQTATNYVTAAVTAGLNIGKPFPHRCNEFDLTFIRACIVRHSMLVS